MAKILYGVSGEGTGHASRARVVAGHLIAQGHQVKIVSYDRGFQALKEQFEVLEITGLSIVSDDNKISKLKTFSENMKKLPDGVRSIEQIRLLFKQFTPDCVISDFEPCCAHLAQHYDLPLISLDNQHWMRYMHYERPAELKTEAIITENVIRSIIPKPWFSLITSFHTGELKNEHCQIFGPIIRPEVLSLTSVEGQKTLVYVTKGFDSLLTRLAHFSREQFIVYGYNKNEVQGNIEFKAFSQQGFAHDLASAKAVIATAGFSLMSEALYLHKPYLALPMQGQLEQQLNAINLANAGFGAYCDQASEKDIAAFFYQLPEYRHNLSQYPREGNEQILAKIDALLANNCQLLYQYQR